jgi:NTP pyrophosphatase (non-canonical NTP hydrolase)
MFNFLSTHEGPVIAGLEDFETVYAKNQQEYQALRTLPGDRGLSAISRWTPTAEQRKAIAAGADIMLEVYHFGKPLAPVRMMVTDQRGQYFAQWFAVQTNAPYADQLPLEGDPANEPVWEQETPTDGPGSLPFQARVLAWVLATFGVSVVLDTRERNHRFLEESLELVQATGCTASEAHELVEYVFSRPVGDIVQETGGVMVTLAALLNAYGVDVLDCGERELARVWSKIDEIRRKNATKPRNPPLPGPIFANQLTITPEIVTALANYQGRFQLLEPPSRCIGYNSGCDGDLGEAHAPHCPESAASACGSLTKMPEFGRTVEGAE